MVLLMALSAVPWSSLTGNRLKDFNLFGDLLPGQTPAPAAPASVEIDPELESFIAEAEVEKQTELPAEPVEQSRPEEPAPVSVVDEAPVDDDGDVMFEYYSADSLTHFKAALASEGARVAVIGDSFIEGDIFTQDLRRLLQDTYGGEGVGYMSLHSDFPGFRSSVAQSGSGWKMHDLRTFSAHDSLRTLAGEYGRAEGPAHAGYKGVASRPHLGSWSQSQFLFIAPDSGTVTLTTDAGAVTHSVVPSPDVQSLLVDGPTSSLKLDSDIPSLIGLGVYLDGNTGVQVDCMSIRGNSGIGHRRMNRSLAAQMRHFIDYDLIILEYGINALTAEQRDYTAYASAMVSSIERIRSCYPAADIIVMGIADRGVKQGTEVLSMPTCPAMVKAQRDAARRTGAVFFDTRQAMGGDGAAVDWRKRKLMNADYIHINHDGGRELASIFHRSLSKALNE